MENTPAEAFAPTADAPSQTSYEKMASYRGAHSGPWPQTHLPKALGVGSPIINTTTKPASFLLHWFSRLAYVPPFWLYVCYFLSLSFLGFLLLRFIPSRRQPSDLDMFFTSVSSATASSMAAVEMESFSDAQLLVMTGLMLVGGEVFTSMVELWFVVSNHDRRTSASDLTAAGYDHRGTDYVACQLELGWASGTAKAGAGTAAQHTVVGHRDSSISSNGMVAWDEEHGNDDADDTAVRYLGSTVVGYFVGVQLVGFVSILAYLFAVPSAGKVLRDKQIRLATFSLFTVVSTFSNCGFIPNNEGLVAFMNNPGLLLILCHLVVAGNTLFPPLLRLVLSSLRRVSRSCSRKSAADRLLAPGGASRYHYPPLLSPRKCRWLTATVVGLAAVQMALFCGMEWSKESGLGSVRGTFRKLVAALFMSLSSRHSGQSVADLSSVASSILVLYVVVMYLPGNTYFLPTSSEEGSQLTTNNVCSGTNPSNSHSHTRKGGGSCSAWRDFHLPHISYIALFTILICFTERRSISADPLNFSVLNVVFEVVSAYGNVGFTTGYSCQRQLTSDPSCISPSYGFVGAWSNKGKLLLVLVMIFGRLKKLTMGGGKAWKIA